MIVSMRETFPYLKIKCALVFLCVSVAAYALSSIVLSLLDSRLVPVKPRLPAPTTEAKRDLEKRLSVDHYRSIWEKNIFFTTGGGPKGASEPIQVDQLSLTSLNCSLIGTIVEEKSDGWAVIMDNEGGQQEMVTVGSHFKGARVVRILKDKVVLNINGKDELLLLDMEERPEQTSASAAARSSSTGQVLTYNISRSLVQQSLNDLASVMSQVRVEPYFRGGKPDGFRLSQMQSGSLLSNMGFQNGDVIKSVNGRDIGTAEDAMRLYDTMKGSSFFRVGIVRDNGPKTIQIRVR
jgi:general secretion pathway protein C